MLNMFSKEFKHNVSNFLKFLPDTAYIKFVYFLKVGKTLNLHSPRCFSEKLQWLKLYDRKELYTSLVDKYEVKKYITTTLREGLVVPTLGVWDDFEQIDFAKLPEKFVLKCTHDSGGLVVCRDKSILNFTEVKEKISKSLKTNFFWIGREWPYKNVKPRIIAEPLLENTNHEKLKEYNFFCFNGEPRFCTVCWGDRDKGEARYNDYYDIAFNRLKMECSYASSNVIEKKPVFFEELVNYSRKLSKQIPFARIDWYVCNNKIYFGEITLYHWSGFCNFRPLSYDKVFGDLLELPKRNV